MVVDGVASAAPPPTCLFGLASPPFPPPPTPMVQYHKVASHGPMHSATPYGIFLDQCVVFFQDSVFACPHTYEQVFQSSMFPSYRVCYSMHNHYLLILSCIVVCIIQTNGGHQCTIFYVYTWCISCMCTCTPIPIDPWPCTCRLARTLHSTNEVLDINCMI